MNHPCYQTSLHLILVFLVCAEWVCQKKSLDLLIHATQPMFTECPLQGGPRLGEATDRKQSRTHFQAHSLGREADVCIQA